MQEKGKKKYYRIRAGLFWLMIGGFVLLLLGVYFKDELYEKWLRSGGMENVSYEGVQSALEDQGSCYLCGSSDYSLIDYYRKFDTIGLISLNDWYVLDFRLKCHDENGSEVNGEDGTSTSFGNTGEIIYSTESNFRGTMASIEVTFPEDYQMKTETIRGHLCQKCLNKVLESLEFRKWKYEKKEAVPLCLVDFKTLEIYSLQDWHRGCRIQNYWVEIEPDGNKITVEAYTIPDQKE